MRTMTTKRNIDLSQPELSHLQLQVYDIIDRSETVYTAASKPLN